MSYNLKMKDGTFILSPVQPTRNSTMIYLNSINGQIGHQRQTMAVILRRLENLEVKFDVLHKALIKMDHKIPSKEAT